MEQKERVDHKERINEVIRFIGTHLDSDLGLEQLSNIACFSKYHFHRLFTAHTGLSLQQYVRWLRLKRAALQLLADRSHTIIDIALKAGFESHESFSRAFKQVCGQSPSEFRMMPNWDPWEDSPFSLIKSEQKPLSVAVEHLSQRRLAVIDQPGNGKHMDRCINALITWARAQTIPLNLRPGETFGFGYDDPQTPLEKSQHFALGITVPPDLKLNGTVAERILPSGRYAIAEHRGSYDNIANTVHYLYRDWLPDSGEELGDLPCLFCYYNFGHEVAETELITEIWLLLRDK